MTHQTAVIDTAQIEQAGGLVGALARLDVSGLSQHEFLSAYDAVAKLGRLTDALRARFAGDLARRSTPDLPGGGLARRQGFGDAGAMVAAVTGGSQAGAWRSIEAGRAFIVEPTLPFSESSQLDRAHLDQSQRPTPPTPRFPAITAAALAGDLSSDAAGIITSGLESLADRVPGEQLHDLEQRLVDKAIHLSVKDVRRLVTRAVARADLAGHQERERRQHEDRYLTWSEDHTGMVTLNGRLDAVTAAPIRTVIEQMVTHQFRARRDQDPTERDQRTVGQLRADALHDLARHALGCKNTDQSGVRTTIIVRMSLTDLTAGEGLGSIDGTAQPVSVGELRRLAGDAGVIPQVLGGPSEVLDQGRNVRIFTRAQRLALVERDGGCAKCHAPPEHCEAHHIRWWEKGGLTDLSNGVMLCTRCHHDIHRQGWGITIRDGRVEFIPPPNIDPLQRPRLGGLAALEIGDPSVIGDASDTSDPGSDFIDADPPDDAPRENSAHDYSARENPAHMGPGWENPARENSAQDYSAREHSARRAA